MKKHGAFWMHLYPLLLFAIIVLSLLFLVMTGTGLYSAVVDSQTRNREARAALSYLAARGACGGRGGLFPLGKAPRARALLLRENADGETYETVFIYMKARCGRNMGRQMLRWTRRTQNASWMQNRASVEQVRPGLLVVSTEYGSADIALRSGRGLSPDAWISGGAAFLCGNAAFGTLSACQPDRAGADTGCCKAYLTGGQELSTAASIAQNAAELFAASGSQEDFISRVLRKTARGTLRAAYDVRAVGQRMKHRGLTSWKQCWTKRRRQVNAHGAFCCNCGGRRYGFV